MSTGSLVTNEVPATDTARCDACQHREAAHDTISRRYCAATVAAGATSRDCICAGQ